MRDLCKLTLASYFSLDSQSYSIMTRISAPVHFPINNSNPILNELSEERKLLERKNIEVSYDGMEVLL